MLSFDDDIQGTGATACAALLDRLRIKKQRAGRRSASSSCGIGQAGVGTAWAIRAVLAAERAAARGDPPADLRRSTMQGLAARGRPRASPSEQRPFAQARAAVAGWTLEDPARVSLKDVVRNVKATVLVGYTATRGLFDAELLGRLAENTPSARWSSPSRTRPTAPSAPPRRRSGFTGGTALVATGSPFPPVHWEGREVATSQCNNLYIFPGIGLGALVSPRLQGDRPDVRRAPPAPSSPWSRPRSSRRGCCCRAMEQIREVAFAVAREVALEARDSGLGRLLEDGEIDDLVRRAMWDARIFPYRPGTLR